MTNAVLANESEVDSSKESPHNSNMRKNLGGISFVSIFLSVMPLALAICIVFIYQTQQTLTFYKNIVKNNETLLTSMRNEQVQLKKLLEDKEALLLEATQALEVEKQKNAKPESMEAVAVMERWSILPLMESLEAKVKELSNDIKSIKNDKVNNTNPPVNAPVYSSKNINVIQANVLAVDIANEMVAISVGSVDGAFPGMHYDVWDGDIFVTRILLDEIHETVSLAKSAPGYTSVGVALVREDMTLEWKGLLSG